MRILEVLHGFLPESRGGTEQSVLELAKSLRARGHDVTVLCGSFAVWNPAGREAIEIEGIPVIRLHRADLFFDAWDKAHSPDIEVLFREELRRLRPAVVHVHQWIRLTDNLIQIATEEGLPAVATLHDLYTTCPRCFRVRPPEHVHCDRPLAVESCLSCAPRRGWETEEEIRLGIELYRDTYRCELELARAVLTPAPAVSRLVAAATGFPEERLQAIGNAYTPRTGVARRPPVAPPRPGETYRIGCWGNVTWRKGLDVLLEAFRRMLAMPGAPPATLHIWGRIDTKELEERLQGLAARLPVTFHGAYDFEEILRTGHHVGVVPAICFETFGFVLDETFELGLPAVVSDLGALQDRVGEAGLRFRPGDAEDLARALHRLGTDPALHARCTAAIPPPPDGPAAHAERILAIYEDAAARGPLPLARARRVDPRRRLRLEFLRRESSFVHHLERGEGSPPAPR